MDRNKKYPDKYKLTRSWWITIPLWFFAGVLTYGCFEFDWQRDWLLLSFLFVFCLWFLYVILQDIEYAIFSHSGVMIVHAKRWGKNKSEKEFYIDWKDVRYIRFNMLILGHRTPPAITIESRVSGRGYSYPTGLSYRKFAALARYYSAREGIVYRWKRKPFEKDW